MDSLNEQYGQVVSRYSKLFCKKLDSDYNLDSWVGQEVGGILEVADMYVNFDDIRYDIDNNIRKGVYKNYYYFSIDLILDGKPDINYKNYLKLNK